ncbi:MAG: aspartate carbamoyltransferase, partial [Novipirellula sp. JB048]
MAARSFPNSLDRLKIEKMPEVDAIDLAFPANWHRRHLLDLESLSAAEIQILLDTAQKLKALTGGCRNNL